MGGGWDGLRDAWRRKTVRFRLRSRPAPGATGSAELELELAELGLSGSRFGPREYAVALERRLGVRILFSFIDHVGSPAVLRKLAAEGRLAEARYLEHRDAVLVTLPGNLSPFLLALTAFHELAHVAAGDVVPGKRLARRPPLEDPDTRESEADGRARHLYLAGSLGSDNPGALELYGMP